MRLPFALALVLAPCGAALLTACGTATKPADSVAVDSGVHAILLVVDNSDSMQDEAAALALADLPAALAGKAWRLDVTTTSVQSADAGQPQPGDGGTSVLGGVALTSDDAHPSAGFQQAILCQATCFSANDVPSDPTYVCDPSAAPDLVSAEYLDCVCGQGAWEGHCGSGNEMGLEAAELMLCRATATTSTACMGYDDPNGGTASTALSAAEIGAYDLREGATDVSVLILSDEGDGSYRQATGDSDGALYTGLYTGFGASVSVVGPWYADGAGDCLSGALPWAVERYQAVAAGTGGAYATLTDGPDAGCAASDMAAILAEFVAGL